MYWLKELPEWVATAVVTPVVLGLGYWCKGLITDKRKAREDDRTELKELREKVIDLLNTATLREKELYETARQDAEMSKQRIEVWRTTNDVLSQLAKILVKREE